MDIAHSLMIKYGLGHQPTDSEVAAWTQETERLIRLGYKADDAGLRSASQVFSDAGTHKYASQADTIEALLDAAKKRK